MTITLNKDLYNFCEELNDTQLMKGKFSAIVLDECRVELYFTDEVFSRMDNENSRTYRKFKKLLDKYDLEYDLIRYKCFEVCKK